LHLTSSPIDWYAARAAGIAAYVVLTFVVVLGLALSGRVRSRRWGRFAVEDVHRFGSLLVGSLVVLHVLTIAIDSSLSISPIQIVVPFASDYRPLWTGVGIVAAELLVAAALANRYRSRIPDRVWRHARYAGVAVWTAATLHGLGAGTDRNATWLFVFYSASAAAVVALVLRRALRPRGRVIVVGAIAAVLAVAFISALPGAGSRERHSPPSHDLVQSSAVRSSPSPE